METISDYESNKNLIRKEDEKNRRGACAGSGSLQSLTMDSELSGYISFQTSPCALGVGDPTIHTSNMPVTLPCTGILAEAPVRKPGTLWLARSSVLLITGAAVSGAPTHPSAELWICVAEQNLPSCSFPCGYLTGSLCFS